MSFEITITSHYGTLSRGRHSARQVHRDGTVQWAPKDAHGNIVITEPGIWRLHCSDGFKREARATLTVDDEGYWELDDTKRFRVLD